MEVAHPEMWLESPSQRSCQRGTVPAVWMTWRSAKAQRHPWSSAGKNLLMDLCGKVNPISRRIISSGSSSISQHYHWPPSLLNTNVELGHRGLLCCSLGKSRHLLARPALGGEIQNDKAIVSNPALGQRHGIRVS